MLFYLLIMVLVPFSNKLIDQSADRKMSQSAEKRALMATGEGRWSQFWFGNWKRNNFRKTWKLNCKWLYCEQRRNWIFVFAFQCRSRCIDFVLDIEDMSKCNKQLAASEGRFEQNVFKKKAGGKSKYYVHVCRTGRHVACKDSWVLSPQKVLYINNVILSPRARWKEETEQWKIAMVPLSTMIECSDHRRL